MKKKMSLMSWKAAVKARLHFILYRRRMSGIDQTVEFCAGH